MKFYVYQCKKDPDYFIVTDEDHRDSVKPELCPRGGGLEDVGEFPELGGQRVAFNETLAKNVIQNHGYYVFEAKSFRSEGQPPGPMPG